MLNPSGDVLRDSHHPSPSMSEGDLGMIIIRIEEDLHFGNVTQLKEIIRRIEIFGAPHVHPSEERRDLPINGLIIQMENVTAIDAESVSILREIIQEFQSRDCHVYFVNLKDQPHLFLRRGRVIGPKGILGKQCLFATLSEAIESMRKEIQEQMQRHEIVDMNEESDFDPISPVLRIGSINSPASPPPPSFFSRHHEDPSPSLSPAPALAPVPAPTPDTDSFKSEDERRKSKIVDIPRSKAKNDEELWESLLESGTAMSFSFRGDSLKKTVSFSRVDRD